MHGKRTKTIHRLCVCLLISALIFSLLPSSALAAKVRSITDEHNYEQTTTVTMAGADLGTTMTIESYIERISESVTIKATDVIFVLDQSAFVNGENGSERTAILNGVKEIINSLPTPTTDDENMVAIVGYGRINQGGYALNLDTAADSTEITDSSYPGVGYGESAYKRYDYNTGFYLSPTADADVPTPVSGLSFYSPVSNGFFGGTAGIADYTRDLTCDSDFDELPILNDVASSYMTYKNAFMTAEQAIETYLKDETTQNTKMCKFSATASRLDAGMVIANQLLEQAKENAVSTDSDRNLLVCVVSGSNCSLQNNPLQSVIRNKAAVKGGEMLKSSGATVLSLGDYHKIDYNFSGNKNNKITDDEANFKAMMTAISGSSKTTTGNEEAQYFFSAQERGSLSEAIKAMATMFDEVAEEESQMVTVGVTVAADSTVTKNGEEVSASEWQSFLKDVAEKGGSAAVTWADYTGVDDNDNLTWTDNYGSDSFSVAEALTVGGDGSATLTFSSSLLPLSNTMYSAKTGTKVIAVISGIARVTYAWASDADGYAPDDAELPESIIVNSDGFKVASAPTTGLTGYTFLGWYREEDKDTDDVTKALGYDALEIPTGDMTLYGKWEKEPEPIYYTVSYDLNEGSVPDGLDDNHYDPVTVNAGGSHDVKEAPEREGHSFVGWKQVDDSAVQGATGDDLLSHGDTIEDINNNITLIAQWSKNTVDVPTSGTPSTVTYTLTYVSNGGTEYAKENYASGTQVDLTKSPIRTGYTFTGWYTDEGLTEIVTSVKMTGNITVYAGWKVTTVPSLLDGDDHIAYIIGYDDGDVKPTGNITRAEVATIFFRLLTAEARDGNLTTENNFSDVNAGSWYNQPVSTMAALGLITGRSDGTFDPNAPITRAEFAAICARFETTVSGYGSDFSDISGHWAESAIQEAARLGWISGYPDGTFRPNQNITRGEAASIINRVLCRIPADKSDLLADMNVWPDNTDTSKFYYLAIQEATNTHESVSKGEINETWTQLTADPDWKRYEK